MESAGAEASDALQKNCLHGICRGCKNLGDNKELSCSLQGTDYPDSILMLSFSSIIPGFNFRIAEFAKKSGFRVFYYISPKLWAWKESRVEKSQEVCRQDVYYFPV